MRALIIAASAALALAACGDGETEQTVGNEAEPEAVVSIATNDTTAIDAATADAANMAADVDYTLEAADNAGGNSANNASENGSGSRRGDR